MDDRLRKLLEEYARLYPPLITLKQAELIAQVPMGTIYDWSSRGLFLRFKSRRGRHIRLNRDEFVCWLFPPDRQ